MENRLGNNNLNQRRLAAAHRNQKRKQTASNKDVFVGNIAEKRYLWTARAFAIITAISMCCGIVLILAIFQVMPLFRIEPFLLSFQNKNEQIVKIKPLEGGMESQKKITETFIRQYVLLRSSFTRDITEMEARWYPDGAIQELSSSAVYQDFLKNTAEKALSIIKARGLTRKIKILTVNELSKGWWQVEYETSDMLPESVKPKVNAWTASIEVDYRRKQVKYDERFKNPVGFTVKKYSLTHNGEVN